MAKKHSMKKVSKASLPIGVAILAVLAWISSFATLILAIGLLTGSAAVSTIISNVAPELAPWAAAGTVLIIFLGIIALLCAVLNFYIGRGLWQGKNWARILVLVLSGLSALGAISSWSIVGLAINALIIWYLGFYKPALSYFK